MFDIIVNPLKAKSSRLAYDVDFVSDNLDDSKRETVEKALASNDIFLLQGPPGTGKTTFISELVAQIIRYEPTSRILISSQSNVAVNHSMIKIKELIPSIPMIRVGRKEKLSLGVEKFLIEEQLANWTITIKDRCIDYLEKFKISINISQDIVNKYKLMQDIEELHNRLDRIQIDVIECEKERSMYKSRYNALRNVLLDIKTFSDKAFSASTVKYDTELESIVENFRNEYFSLGERFINQLDAINEISDKKQVLDKQIKQLENERDRINAEIESGKEILNIYTNDDYYKIKMNLEKEIEENKKLYDNLAKIESITKEWFNRLGKDDDFAKAFLSQVSIIGATCLGIASVSYVNNLKFDWVIIDEAGRATPPELLVPTLLGKKVVLVGDHMQLPPIISKALDNENFKEEGITKQELEVSLFEHLEKNISEECKGVLTDQYRMHPGIGNLISKVFYKNKLVSKTDPKKKNHALKRWQGKGVIWVSTYNKHNKNEQPINLSSSHKTYRNTCEAEVIFNLLKDIDKEYGVLKLHKEVGIIAGYQAQKQLLKKVYESTYKNSLNNISIEIDTVDAFQGRETDIILYSIVRSNKEGKIGFLSDVRRLNVALSRARELLILVGDHRSVTKNNFINEENPFIGVLDYIESNGDLCKLEEA